MRKILPVGCKRGVCAVVPAGVTPQSERRTTGDAETEMRRAEAAMKLVKDCILMGFGVDRGREIINGEE
jgi:hypothetical protein